MRAFLLIAVVTGLLVAVVVGSPAPPQSTQVKNGTATSPCETHSFGRWYKQAAIDVLPEQPAHICKRCGTMQNSSGLFMKYVRPFHTYPDGSPGGQGTLSEKDAVEAVRREILRDFKSWKNYEKAEAEDRY